MATDEGGEQALAFGCAAVLVGAAVLTGITAVIEDREDAARVGTVQDHEVREAYCDEDWGCYDRRWRVYVEYTDGSDGWETVTRTQYDDCGIGQPYPGCMEKEE